MKNYLYITALFCVLLTSMQAQQYDQYIKKKFQDEVLGTMPYRMLLPENYDASKKYPLVLLLHGSGERGNDNELQLVHGASLFLKDEIRKSFPAIIVFPQCAADSYWSNLELTTDDQGTVFNFSVNRPPTTAMKLLNKLLDHLLESYPVNLDRVYVGGLSMGGMGTFEIVKRRPDLFAAAFPICGGAHPGTARKLIAIPWWIFHGEQDNVVPSQFSVVMSEAIKKAGGNAKLTLYPNTGHDSWTQAFNETELLPWLFSQQRN